MDSLTKVFVALGLLLLVAGVYGSVQGWTASRTPALPTPGTRCSDIPGIAFGCPSPGFGEFLLGLCSVFLGAGALIYASTRWE